MRPTHHTRVAAAALLVLLVVLAHAPATSAVIPKGAVQKMFNAASRQLANAINRKHIDQGYALTLLSQNGGANFIGQDWKYLKAYPDLTDRGLSSCTNCLSCGKKESEQLRAKLQEFKDPNMERVYRRVFEEVGRDVKYNAEFSEAWLNYADFYKEIGDKQRGCGHQAASMGPCLNSYGLISFNMDAWLQEQEKGTVSHEHEAAIKAFVKYNGVEKEPVLRKGSSAYLAAQLVAGDPNMDPDTLLELLNSGLRHEAAIWGAERELQLLDRAAVRAALQADLGKRLFLAALK